MSRSCFLPPYLVKNLAERLPGQAPRFQRVLALDEALRLQRAAAPLPAAALPAAPAGVAWVVHDAGNGPTLPGEPVRSAGEPETGDPAVDEAAAGLTGSLALFEEAFGRSSYDGEGAAVMATVHYERDYPNAFWNGAQLVFGDGDGEIFDRFTKPVDVLGHEFGHAVVEHTAALAYEGQPGALNESVADVFGACLKQWLRGQDALEADWLIGQGLFLPGVNGRALRDMAAPGTAYDDPRLGKDPQPDHMDRYVETTEDNGGVHINSGIPNRAFHLAAVAIGGATWEGAGRIWYDALVGGEVSARSDFAAFAAATVAAAGRHQGAVVEAWETVGVRPGAASGAPGPPPAPAAERTVRVQRSGGFAGFVTDGSVDLDTGDDRAEELAELVARIDLPGVARGLPHPDMFVYSFDLCGARATVPEHHLTPELRRVAELVLRQDR